ncbi:MAG: tRNA (cytidine(34)-2'-O)-methyltransferase [Planctomycetes bacterium]|nr:tRNA (cytidine(34)-2'-O)-methyltransferase [Planctomycetota bacterium]
MHLALYQPQIPGNTGNIGRLCVGMRARLEIIGPCAFDFGEKALKRAGLDYWPHLAWTLHPSPEAFLAWLGERQPWLVTKHGRQRFDQPAYAEDDVIILGNEVRGLPDEWHRRWAERTVHIPILGPIRAYNLANAAAMVLSHARIVSGAFTGHVPPEHPRLGAADSTESQPSG